MEGSLSEKVYYHILNGIMNGYYVPGQILNRRELAHKLEVSVSPITEAMVLLESEGLLETLPRKGTQVRLISDNDIAGCLFLRETLECAAVKLIAGKVVEKNKTRLCELAMRVDTALWKTPDFYYADTYFHQTLVDLCKCDILSKEYHKVSTLALYFNPHYLESIESNNNDEVPHLELVELLSKASPEEAAELMRRHIIYGKRNVSLAEQINANV